MELFKLFGTIAINNSDANSAMDETTGKAEKSESKISSAFKKIGAAVVTYFAVDKIKSFGQECVNMASDVEEMQNKFDVVFQGMTDEVEKWAESYASSIGRNSNTIKGYLADNQNMFVGMGMTRDQAAGLSENLVSLALDLASFNNLNEDDAVNAMSKALMGETESAKQLGAVLNDNTRAMAMEALGYEGKYDSLTEAQKMEVNYQAILMQSTDAVGDCERSLDSYKGQQIQLTSTMENLKEKIGGYLLPTMTKLTEKFNNVATFVTENLDPAIESAKETFIAVGDYLSETFAPVFDNLKEIFDKLKEAVQPLVDKITDYVSSGEAATDSTNALKDAVQLVADALETATDYISDFITWMEEHPETVETFATIVGSVAAAVVLVNTAISIYNGVIAISTAVTTGFGTVLAFVTSPITLVVLAIGALIAVGVLLYKNWDTIKEKCSDFATSIKEKFNDIKEKVVGVFEDIKSGISEKIKDAKDTVKAAIDKIKEFFTFDVELPHINLPHFSISPSGWKIGDLLKGEIPSLGIDWYAKAMNDPMVMTQPTAFGVNGNGQIMAGGEAGSEVVSGTNTLMGMISQAVAAQNADLLAMLSKILVAIMNMDDNMGGNMREALAGTSFQVNNREFARLVKAVN